MRNEQAHEKTGTKELLVAGVMDLALVVAFVLSLGSAPTKLDRSFIDVGKPEAAEVVSPSPDNTPPAETIAKNDSVDESNSLDLQLD